MKNHSQLLAEMIERLPEAVEKLLQDVEKNINKEKE